MQKKQTETGVKAYQRQDQEWRSKPYSDWHRTLDRRLLMTDVDFIEWRYRQGELVAVAVIEVTRVDRGKTVNSAYLQAIIARFETRDMQAKAARKVATALGVSAYIVLFREDCSQFWVYNLSHPQDWQMFDPLQMEQFLLKL
ncbi:MAG: hypothetical protein HC921_04715 [Synechococcaceae cyanobacterium SM2_3_1]|nr:hypothetical protein [Synechococcaceae cyanobacterium SM2_3_1]